MRRRHLLFLPLLAACGPENDDMTSPRRPGARFNRGRIADVSYPPPGYDAFLPVGVRNVVAVGDSGTQGFGDGGTPLKGGWVSRHINDHLIPTYGADKFRFRGTNLVRDTSSVHFTEGHGGLEFKPEDEWGSLAAGVTVDNVDQALLNKPISGEGTGRPMFGLGGYHQYNLHLVIWSLGAGNVNNYSETPAEFRAMHVASLLRIRGQLNQTSPGCLLGFTPSMLDWGGTTELAAATNHQRVLDLNAVLSGIVSDFNAVYPSQPLIDGASTWYTTMGLWNHPTPNVYGWPNPTVPGDWFDTVHPNEPGYTRLSGGMWTFLESTYAAIAA